ncbi:MAG: hypothetical protein KGQ51_18910 [Planctomycetes bacterium]|nr:hypothetical protein [Planctomycetota bacterium]
MKSSFQSLVDVIRVLHSLDIPYMLVGAFSSNAYSYPRATKDADIVIDYRDGVLTQICSALGEDFQLDAQASFEIFTGTLRNILTYKPTKFEIELFRVGRDPHHIERFTRRRKLLLPELQIEAAIPTAEDVVIQKLRWQRDKDIADARVVLAVQAQSLNWDYINKWTEIHQTSELLDRLRRETNV